MYTWKVETYSEVSLQSGKRVSKNIRDSKRLDTHARLYTHKAINKQLWRKSVSYLTLRGIFNIPHTSFSGYIYYMYMKIEKAPPGSVTSLHNNYRSEDEHQLY